MAFRAPTELPRGGGEQRETLKEYVMYSMSHAHPLFASRSSRLDWPGRYPERIRQPMSHRARRVPGHIPPILPDDIQLVPALDQWLGHDRQPCPGPDPTVPASDPSAC
jgi:hypothetical protein